MIATFAHLLALRAILLASRCSATRIYTRDRGGETRYYIDLRNLGGGREPLVAPGEHRATTDPDVATKLAAKRVKKAEEEKRGKAILDSDRVGLKAFAAEHVRRKAKDGEGVSVWLSQVELHLEEAVAFFGATTDLAMLSPKDMNRYVSHLRRKDSGRGDVLSDTTVRKYLNSLSNLYARAVSEEYVDKNTVANMYSKPTETKTEAAYLEPEEAALLLESARTYLAPVEDGGFAHMYPLLSTFLLTGGRKSEVLGLEVDDVSLGLGKVYFRPNGWRKLKTRGSKRAVPLWPQLRDILQAYMLDRERTGVLGSLLFPVRPWFRGEDDPRRSEGPHPYREPCRVSRGSCPPPHAPPHVHCGQDADVGQGEPGGNLHGRQRAGPPISQHDRGQVWPPTRPNRAGRERGR